MDSGVVHNRRGQSVQRLGCTWMDELAIIDALPPQPATPMTRHFDSRPAFIEVPVVQQRSVEAGVHMDSGMIFNLRGQSIQQLGCTWIDELAIVDALPSQPAALQYRILHPPQGYSAANYPPILTAPIRVSPTDGRLRDVRSEPTSQPMDSRSYGSQIRNHISNAASRNPHSQNSEAANRPSGNIMHASLRRNHVLHVASTSRLNESNESNSYEELLALGEQMQIGIVSTGLPEEDIVCHLKARRYIASRATSSDQEQSPCTICQEEYEDNDTLGTLECGHEYHVDCIKKWLLVKNVCPLCKATALIVKS